MEKKFYCPRCEKMKLDVFPALSRRDNRTEICSDCGTEEAICDLLRSHVSRLTDRKLDNPWYRELRMLEHITYHKNKPTSPRHNAPRRAKTN
jgi:hypothetical protein